MSFEPKFTYQEASFLVSLSGVYVYIVGLQGNPTKCNNQRFKTNEYKTFIKGLITIINLWFLEIFYFEKITYMKVNTSIYIVSALVTFC
jgi:hypothetical protein